MNVVVIESTAFEQLSNTVKEAVTTIKSVIEENQQLKDDRWMDVKEACKYIGFERQWLLKHKEEIGCFQDGTAIRFKRSDLDAYCKSKFLKKRN